MNLERPEVFVLAAPGRDQAHATCYPSIEASDVGQCYTVCEHPPGMSAPDHWRATHLRAAQASSEFVVVLEDDVLVNRHLLHNCATWRWRRDPRFGAGWLFRPGGFRGTHDDWYPTHKWHCTQGVLYPTALLPELVELAWARMHDRHRTPWDVAISLAVWDAGRKIRMHGPSLVEHLVDVPSVVGNPLTLPIRRSGDTYRSEWKRPEGDPHWGL